MGRPADRVPEGIDFPKKQLAVANTRESTRRYLNEQEAGPRRGRVAPKGNTIGLQKLRARLHAEAKADPEMRFGGLYGHLVKLETLHQSYLHAKGNNGAPGSDRVSFEQIEGLGRKEYLQWIQRGLRARSYRPSPARRVVIPKPDGGERVLSIPTIRDRVVQGATRLILEPVFEADFQDGSFGYRPNRTQHDAVERVRRAIETGKTMAYDMDLAAFFDTVRHDKLLQLVARRVQDGKVLHLLKLFLKSTGKRGVPQGGVISPLLSNLYLDPVDRELEVMRARGEVEYARYADDLVVLVEPSARIQRRIEDRLSGQFARLGVAVNDDKTQWRDLVKGESLAYLGFSFALNGRRLVVTPTPEHETALLDAVSDLIRLESQSASPERIRDARNCVLGKLLYLRIGDLHSLWPRVGRMLEEGLRPLVRGEVDFGAAAFVERVKKIVAGSPYATDDEEDQLRGG